MMIASGGAVFYRTYMVDPLVALPPGLGNAIQSQLVLLFGSVISSVFGVTRPINYIENNWVFFNPTAAAPVKHELLVYFMPPRTSIVKHAPTSGPPDLSANGNTIYRAGASEVYVKSNGAVGLAKLAFHEFMHNRLKQSDNQLHPQGGLAGASITSSTRLNHHNKESMAAVLLDPIKQWTSGITILNNGMHDPMSEYYRI